MSKNTLTPLGKFLRKRRDLLDLTLREVAKKLGVSSAYLSAIDYGKKTISPAVLDKLVALFALSENEVSHMHLLMKLSSEDLTVDLSTCSKSMKLLFVELSTNSTAISSEKIKVIRSIIRS